MHKNKLKTLFITFLVIAGSSAYAQPVPRSHADGTVHYFESFTAPSGIAWQEASDIAAEMGGYLATITSAEENDFVFSLIENDSYWYERRNGELDGPWTGGFQIKGSPNPLDDWHWISGESVEYSNWTENQPNNVNARQNRIHFGAGTEQKVSTWSDIDADSRFIQGYVVEYSAPVQTLGLFLNDYAQSFEGYTLFAPQNYNEAFLIDNQGRKVHSWSSATDMGNAAYLLENGNLLRTVELEDGVNPRFVAGGYNGRLEEFDWDGNLVWEFDYSTPEYMSHHDAVRLPNGNTLIVAWELKTTEEAIQAGRNPEFLTGDELWPDKLIEVQPTGLSTGTIVWEWHLWDHLIQDFDPAKDNYGDVAEHPELFDINFYGNYNPGAADWNHVNGIDYNADLDQIIISSHHQSELWVIDHSTTMEEAANHTGGNSGKGGDFLYRWGNPQSYRAGTADDQILFGQHNTQWIKPGLPGAGNIMLFNNGNGRPDGQYSTIEEFTPPVDGNGNYVIPMPGEPFSPSSADWQYMAETPTDFYGHIVSGVQRQPNGNTLICNGPLGDFFEITPALETVWEYVNPIIGTGPLSQGESIPGSSLVKENMTFRAIRYSPDYQAFAGRELRPQSFIEIYQAPAAVIVGLNPLTASVVIPPEGGNLEYELYLENIGSSPQSFDAWLDLAYENGTATTLFNREIHSFLPGMNLSRDDLYYPIPESYQAGDYYLTLKIGHFPDNVVNESSFVFEKAGIAESGGFVPFEVDGAPNPFEDAITVEITVPAEFVLLENYPNPFNPTTTIQFSLPNAGVVNLSVFDLNGRLVNNLINGNRASGNHTVEFDGSALASGVYFYRLAGENFTATRKMMLVK